MPPTTQIGPEIHCINPTPHVPNSKLPVLVYRGALSGTSPEDMVRAVEANKWLKAGRWKTYKTSPFHTTVHECYAVAQGSTKYELGKSPLDADYDNEGRQNGKVFNFQQGDVFVLPAGVSHCSLESEGDYEHIGFYPRDPISGGKAKFDMHYGLKPEETAALAANCEKLPVPTIDPLYGPDGPLPKLWMDAQEKTSSS